MPDLPPPPTGFSDAPPPPEGYSLPPAPSGFSEIPSVTSAVQQFKGAKYAWGGNAPEATDCSGMACQVMKQFGIDLPRTAEQQFNNPGARKVASDPKAMQPGDAIYFQNTGGRQGISHVAVYLGDGRYAAMSGQKTGYKEGTVGDSLWKNNLAGVRRFLPDTSPTPSPNPTPKSQPWTSLASYAPQGKTAQDSATKFLVGQPNTPEQDLLVKFFNNRTDKSDPNLAANALASNPQDAKWLPRVQKMNAAVQKLIWQKAAEYRQQDADEANNVPMASMGDAPSGVFYNPTTKKLTTPQAPSEMIAQGLHGTEGAKVLAGKQGFVPALQKLAYSLPDPQNVGLLLASGGAGEIAPILKPVVSGIFAGWAGKQAYDKAKNGDVGGAVVDALMMVGAGAHAGSEVAKAIPKLGNDFAVPEPYSRTEVMNKRAPRQEDAFSTGIGLSDRQVRRVARTEGKAVPQVAPQSVPKTESGFLSDEEVSRLGGVNQKSGAASAVPEQPNETVQPSTPMAQPETPGDVTTPVEGPKATGLANQVQAREAEANILSQIEATKGKSPEQWQAIGREKINTDSDFEGLAGQVAKGDIELTGERVGVLLEGKRRLVNAVNEARDAADANPTKDTQAAYTAARQRLDDYVTNVQAGKGRWSDVGRALQAGTDLDTGNFAEVLTEAKRRGVPVNEKKLQDLTGQVAAKDAEIEAHKARIAELEAAGQTPQQARTTVRGERKVARVKALDDEFDQLYAKWTQARKPSKPMGKQTGAINIPTDQIALAYKMAKNRAQRLGVKMEDAIAHVYDHLKPDMSLDDFRTALLTQTQKVKVLKQASNRKLEAIYGLPKGEGPTKGITDPELDNLRAERDYWSRRVQQSLRPPKSLLNRATSVVRGAILGSDVGTLTRQGLPAWGRVLAGDMSAPKATGQAAKVAFSEPAMRRLELQRVEERLPDGRLKAVVEKNAGLRISDRILDPEEMGIGSILGKRLGVVGHTLERFQHTFVNEARRNMFWKGYDRGMNPEQLQEWAKFVNTVTGRGNAKQVPEMMNTVLTSANYELSRWATLGEVAKSPVTLAKAVATKDPVAIEKVKTLGGTAALIYLTFKGAELAGYKTNYDPSSPDFMKLRKGNDVWDISAGLAPRARDLYAITMALLHPGYKGNLRETAGKAVTRTISPGITVPTQQASYAIQRREKVPEAKIANPITGMKADAIDKSWGALAPLIYQSFRQALDAEGPKAAAWAGAREFIGSNVSRYPAKSGGSTPSMSFPKDASTREMDRQFNQMKSSMKVKVIR